MKQLKFFFDLLKKIFIKIPVYLRGLFLFLIVIGFATITNKCASKRVLRQERIINANDEARYLDSIEPNSQSETFTNKSDLNEQIKVDNKENTVNGTVKENLKSLSDISLRKKSETTTAKSLQFEGDFYFGDENAPITIIEYSSYTCPNCINFHSDTMSSLKTEYIDTGKVKYIKRMIVQNNTLLAVMLPYCAQNSDRFNIVEELYADVDNWINNGSKQKKILKEIALRNGFNDSNFEECIKNKKLGQDLLEKQKKEISELSIYYTPTVFINGEKQTGAIPYKLLKEQIEKELKKLQKGNV